MSVWSYVGATFKIDKPFEHDVYKVFGKECLWNGDVEAFEKSYNEMLDDKSKYLPCGSEGSLQYKEITSSKIRIIGALRDWDNDYIIDDWFTNCCKELQRLGYNVQADCSFDCYPICYILKFEGEPWE